MNRARGKREGRPAIGHTRLQPRSEGSFLSWKLEDYPRYYAHPSAATLVPPMCFPHPSAVTAPWFMFCLQMSTYSDHVLKHFTPPLRLFFKALSLYSDWKTLSSKMSSSRINKRTEKARRKRKQEEEERKLNSQDLGRRGEYTAIVTTDGAGTSKNPLVSSIWHLC